MARFTIPAERFPWSPVQIRTRLGLVDFVAHVVEVDDEDLADALREVPEVFGIVEDEPADDGQGHEQGDGPAGPPAKNASTEAWAEYAITRGAAPGDIEGMSRNQLIERYGG